METQFLRALFQRKQDRGGGVEGLGLRLGRVFARATREIRYDQRGKGSSANSTRSSMLDETCLIPAVADSSQNPRGSRVIAVGPNFRARRKADLPHLG